MIPRSSAPRPPRCHRQPDRSRFVDWAVALQAAGRCEGIRATAHRSAADAARGPVHCRRPEAHRHLRRHRRPLGQDPVESLPGIVPPRGVGHGKAQRGTSSRRIPPGRNGLVMVGRPRAGLERRGRGRSVARTRSCSHQPASFTGVRSSRAGGAGGASAWPSFPSLFGASK